jgi:hypothetical protein
MAQGRWIDQTQPERLVQGTFGLYITGAFDLLNGLGGFPLLLIIAIAKIAGARGIANEKKAGYVAGISGAAGGCLVGLLVVVNSSGTGLIFAMFALAIDVIVFGFLVHPSSRSYQRIWFK